MNKLVQIEAFICWWEAFKVWSKCTKNAENQLFKCAQDKLGDLMLAKDPWLKLKSENYDVIDVISHCN